MHYRRIRKVFCIGCLFLLMAMLGCAQNVTVVMFKPLSAGEKLAYGIDFKQGGKIAIFLNSSDSGSRLLELGITADNRPLVFASGQKMLELVNDGRNTDTNDLWLIDGKTGRAQILTKSTPIYAIDEARNLICLYSGDTAKGSSTTINNNIVLAKIQPFEAIRTFVVSSETGGQFWGRALNDERRKDTGMPLRYDEGSNAFVFKMVNADRYVEQYSIAIKNAELTRIAVSTNKVHLP